MPGTDFVSVQRVPTTVQGLKQALTNQPVIVGVDASDWSDYYDVSWLLPMMQTQLAYRALFPCTCGSKAVDHHKIQNGLLALLLCHSSCLLCF